MSRKTDTLYAIPAIFVAIFVYALVSSQVYVWIGIPGDSWQVYDIAQGLGAILWGILSDFFCRKKTVIISHILAFPFLILVYYFSNQIVFAILFGLVYNPLPILRAALVDNMRRTSKIRLIAYSFVLQFLPTAIYTHFTTLGKPLALLLSIGALIFCLMMIGVLFEDVRDRSIAQHKEKHIFFESKGAMRKGVFTFLAFIPTQFIYFISAVYLDSYGDSPVLYSLLFLGFVIGALISSLYKSTPHTSVLTVTYGVSITIAMIPLCAITLYQYHHPSLIFLFVLLACLAGFYISFVYDVVLHNIGKTLRGSACGMLDGVFFGTAELSLIIVGHLKFNIIIALICIIFSFAFALFFQKFAELHSEIK